MAYASQAARVAGLGFAVLTTSATLVNQSDAAGPESVRLVYTVETDIANCLSAEQFHAAVAARADQTLLVDDAPATLIVTLARDGERLRATLRLETEKSRNATLVESIEGDLDECEALGRAAALTASMTLVRYTEELARAPLALQKEHERPLRKPPRQSAYPMKRWRFETSAGLVIGIALLPEPSAGATSEVASTRGRFRVALGWEAYLPMRARSFHGGAAEVSLRTVRASFCYELRAFFGCAAALGGALRSVASGLREPQSLETPYLALAGQFGARGWLGGPFWFHIGAEVRASAASTTVRSRDEVLWKSPTIGFSGLSAIIVKIP